MKKSTFKMVFITTCTIGLIACKKNEQSVQPTKTTNVHSKVESYVPPKLYNYKANYFKSIDTITPAYLQYTSKLDITGLKNNQSYTHLSDGKFCIDVEKVGNYIVSVTKRDPTTSEWWKNWNVRPYVEANNPSNLSLGDKTSLGTTLLLSKKCYVFGFELAAPPVERNKDGNKFYVSYTDTTLGPYGIVGSMLQTVTYPNGARLCTIKTDTPINEVRFLCGSPNVLRFAITNIRYVTSKEVFDAHKDEF